MKIVCIEEEQVHLLDHLCPMAYFLKAPIVTSNALIEKTVNDFYPNVKLVKLTSSQEILSYLEQSVDVIVMTSQSSLYELSKTLKALYSKAFRYIYLPHGQSDKGFSDQYIDYLKGQDLSFCYGPLMETKLKSRGVFQTLNGTIRTGNFRKTYYETFKAFYKPLIERRLCVFKKKQTTILYAPTWNDLENLSSFELMAQKLALSLPDHFNLIVKLHPYLEQEDPIRVCLLTKLFEKKQNVLLLEDWHIIYPLLEQIDIYLGDFSSIGYDALAFDIPLFFLNTSETKNSKAPSFALFQAGMTVPSENFADVFDFIEKKLQANQQKKKKDRKLLEYQAFGDLVSKDLLQHQVSKKISFILS